MIDTATMVAIARGTPIKVIAVAASAVWRDGFILFIPSYLRQGLALIGGGASSVAHQANRMKRRGFAIAMMNLTFDSRYRGGTISAKDECLGAFFPDRGKVHDGAYRRFHVLHAHPFEPRVESVFACEDVWAGQAHERQP